MGVNGPLPAIAGAIEDALGVSMNRPPLKGEQVLAALGEADSANSV